MRLARIVAIGAPLALIAGVLMLITAAPMRVTRTSDVTHYRRAWIGVIAPSAQQASQLKTDGVSRAVLPASWAGLEPQQGHWNYTYAKQLRSEAKALSATGVKLVLDPGLQYAPAWAFSLPGQTRFVDQYGDQWHGSLGNDVPNAVFNSAVRDAEGVYLAKLGKVLQSQSFVAVRVGGLLSSQLCYPGADYDGHKDLIWDYDPAAQADAPDPGWRPGLGTPAIAEQSLAYYYEALTGYETWQLARVHAAFPKAQRQLLLPSWGLRPGMTDKAAEDGMQDRTDAEVNGMIAQGLDWNSQLAAAAKAGPGVIAYSTWIDAPSQGSSVQDIPPIAFLSRLAKQYKLPVAGENTGGGGVAALQLTLQRARTFHLTGVMYMSATALAQGTDGLTMSKFESIVRKSNP